MESPHGEGTGWNPFERASPANSTLQERHGERDRIRAVWTGALFGLDSSCQGSRWLDGHGRSNGTLARIELATWRPFNQSNPIIRIKTEEVLPGDLHMIHPRLVP